MYVIMSFKIENVQMRRILDSELIGLQYGGFDVHHRPCERVGFANLQSFDSRLSGLRFLLDIVNEIWLFADTRTNPTQMAHHYRKLLAFNWD